MTPAVVQPLCALTNSSRPPPTQAEAEQKVTIPIAAWLGTSLLFSSASAASICAGLHPQLLLQQMPSASASVLSGSQHLQVDHGSCY